MYKALFAALAALFFAHSATAQQKEKMPIPYGTLLGFGITASSAWDECGENAKCKAMVRAILRINAGETLASVVPCKKSCPEPLKITDVLYRILENKE